MTNDYLFAADRIFFKHECSESLPCNAYSMHTHNAYELIWFLDGDATHVIEDRKYKLKKGDLILIPPLRYHFVQIESEARYERYDILFDGARHGVEGFSLWPSDMEVINIAGNEILENIFEKCDFYHRHGDGDTFEKILSHLLSELFYNISLFVYPSSASTDTLSPIISAALRYINENLCTITGVDEIAARLFISESYLFRLFQRELHQTPKKYMLEKRLLLAQRMIVGGERPTAVFEQCGFKDYATFYRSYLSFFGCSPSKSK